MGDDSHNMNDGMHFKWWQYAILALLLIAGFFAIYKVHWSYDDYFINPHSSEFVIFGNSTYYPFPFHADEWTHLAQAQYIVAEHRIARVNPYLRDVPHRDLESGFHIFLASFLALTGLDPVMSYQYLAAIFMVITVLSLFWFLYVVTKNYFISILAPAFLLLIKNNINLMGLWFFLPMTFSLFIIFMFFASYFSKGNIRYLSIIFFIASIIAYPIASVIIVIAIASYEALNAIIHKREELLEKKYWKYYASAIIALTLFLTLYFIGELSSFPLIFKYGWTVFFEHNYMPWEMYGIGALILCVIGLAFVIYKRMNKIFWILPLILVIPVLMYSFFRFSILIPYQRAFFFLLITLAILSAIGTYYLYRMLNSTIKNRWLPISIITIIIAATFITGFASYYHVDDERFRLVHYMEADDYQAMSWIKQNYGSDTRIMGDIFTSFTIYPLTGMQAVAVAPSNLEAGNLDTVQGFFNSQDCNSMASYMSSGRADLVYTSSIISCPQFKNVYSRNNIYIYEYSN